MTYRNPKLLQAVRQLPCANCGAEDGTVCAAHSKYGKGMSIKASDASVMALCYRCHSEHDQRGKVPKQERRQTEFEMNAKTLRTLFERGMVTIK